MVPANAFFSQAVLASWLWRVLVHACCTVPWPVTNTSLPIWRAAQWPVTNRGRALPRLKCILEHLINILWVATSPHPLWYVNIISLYTYYNFADVATWRVVLGCWLAKGTLWGRFASHCPVLSWDMTILTRRVPVEIPPIPSGNTSLHYSRATEVLMSALSNFANKTKHL